MYNVQSILTNSEYFDQTASASLNKYIQDFFILFGW